jgi:glycogen debranching enzyme
MHETRKGEMTALGEVPFGRYYGGVDTTPLYVMLAGAYADRTGDMALIDEIWPVLNAAMAWLEGDGDSDRDGLVDYKSARPTGLANQGWKDSNDSVSHSDGRFPKGPIALVEVQGFAFAAAQAMAKLARLRGEPERAGHWEAAAQDRADRVERLFWSAEQGFYGIAIDGAHALCGIRSSNAGQLLFTGLPLPERAQSVTRALLGATFSGGWGLRTLAMTEARFNPMSYHNGSVWPHDTAICAAGMSRYGERDGVVRLMDDLFAASVHFGMRLPELYCGFPRTAGEPVIAYPVACLPQAWSSGAVFMMLQACLGLTIDARGGEILIDRPHLPGGVDRLDIAGIKVGAASVDLSFERVGRQVLVSSSGADNAVRVVTRL